MTKRQLMSLAAGAVVIAMFIAGCGAESGTGKTATIPECGFSIALPPGWTTEDYAQTEFFKSGDRKNSWGMAKFCPMSGRGPKALSRIKFKTVAEFAKHVIEEEKFDGSLAEVVSQRPLKAGEVQADAHEIIFKDTRGHYAFTMFIEMEGGEALQVFFTVPGDEYESFAKQYSKAAASIRLAKTKPVW